MKVTFHANIWLFVGCLACIVGLLANAIVLYNVMQNIEIRDALVKCNALAMMILGYTGYRSIRQAWAIEKERA